jgi:hypothetical protein
MAFQLKPFKEILAMSKEKLDEALAPIRARQVKAKADSLVANYEEELISIEKDITEKCTSKDVDFEKIADLLDKHALKLRRKEQFESIYKQLFPDN